MSMHHDLMTYVAGTAKDRDCTIADAILLVVKEFKADPKAAAENADMLDGFNPANVTIDEIEKMYRILKKMREFDTVTTKLFGFAV